ncbi:MAG: orotidine-5'-phosphate decarboxylase [Rickettsiales bacterium]|jgi:orotidine-5'-phosphate decarboxylase
MNIQLHNPIICALDTTSVVKAKKLAKAVSESVGAIKLGLEFFTANGAEGVVKVSQAGLPLFLDLKFHDIPNTVAGAIRAIEGMNVFMLTVHVAGGKEMMMAAVEAAKSLPYKPLIIGVTVLTSLDAENLEDIGVNNNVSDQVSKLADLAQESGLDGVVCSPYEIDVLRARCGADFKLIVPGIRPINSKTDDQKRVMTPKKAMEKGADYLVIGRPITKSERPELAAEEIFDSL